MLSSLRGSRQLSVTLLGLLYASMSAPESAEARSYRVTQIPNNPWGCAACHIPPGTGPRNSFGIDVGATLYGSDVDWSALCPLDSDGDGYSNGVELGDPDCLWSIGQPAPQATIYAPYDANDYPMPEPPPPPVGGEPMGGEPMGAYPMGGEPMGAYPMGGEPMGAYPMGGEPMGAYPMGGEPMGAYPMGGEPMGAYPMGGAPTPTPTPTAGEAAPYRPTYGSLSSSSSDEGGCDSTPARRAPWGVALALLALFVWRRREGA